MSLFIEDKSGEVLAEATSFSDKISIGSSDECTICLKNHKLAELESEIYITNDECWLQVGKEGAPVTYLGKQYRSLKLTQSTLLQFRELVFKVILDSVQEFDGEATKIVQQTMAESSETTRLITSSDMLKENNDHESTRVVMASEATRVITLDESTKLVTPATAIEAISFANSEMLEKTLTGVKYEEPLQEPSSTDENNDLIFMKPMQSYLKNIDFNMIKEELIRIIDQFRIKERRVPILGFVFLIAAIFILVNKKSTEKPISTLEAEIKAEKEMTPKERAPGPDLSRKPENSVSSQTKEQYIRDLSSLFN